MSASQSADSPSASSDVGALARERREHGEADRAADLDARVDEARRRGRSPPASRPTSPASSAPGSRGRRRGRSGSSAGRRRRSSCRRPASARTAAGRRRSTTRLGSERRLRAEAHAQPARRRAATSTPMTIVDGQERQADLERGRSRGSAAGRARRGRTSPNMPTTSSACTMFAPTTLRERNSRSGISGFSIRAWRTTKAATSAPETAPRIERLRAEPQPCSLDAEDRVDAEHQAGGRAARRRAGRRPASRPMPGPVARRSRSARNAVRDADRDVDEEDPVPVDRLGQHAAGEQADRAAARRRRSRRRRSPSPARAARGTSSRSSRGSPPR